MRLPPVAVAVVSIQSLFTISAISLASIIPPLKNTGNNSVQATLSHQTCRWPRHRSINRSEGRSLPSSSSGIIEAPTPNTLTAAFRTCWGLGGFYIDQRVDPTQPWSISREDLYVSGFLSSSQILVVWYTHNRKNTAIELYQILPQTGRRLNINHQSPGFRQEPPKWEPRRRQWFSAVYFRPAEPTAPMAVTIKVSPPMDEGDAAPGYIHANFDFVRLDGYVPLVSSGLSTMSNRI